MTQEIEVWADWIGLSGETRMGTLRASPVRGKEVFAFEYDGDWLESHSFHMIDPDLQLYGGPQYLDSDTRPNFGLFLDSSPDRWGRQLMRRREAARSRDEGRPERTLREIDFLLGVHDEQRMGGLRFKDLAVGEAWQSDAPDRITPPWTSLRELENASWQIQREGAQESPLYPQWLNLLVAPGSSLGGARPKAGVRDEQGDLWIAKFPGRNDERDMGAWERVTHELARHAGLNVTEAQTGCFSGEQHTFLVRRFDRQPRSSGRGRIHFASAMTLLGRSDGTDHTAGTSYLDLAELLIRHGASPSQDLHELWRRIVFSIAIRNTDDHLRNHGFLLTQDGWRLSPAFDLNPDPEGLGLTLNISETDNALDLDLAFSVAHYFRVDAAAARETVRVVQSSVSKWHQVATQFGIRRSEQEAMQRAFSV